MTKHQQGKPVALDGVIDNGTHRLVARVYYADTDFSGAVYHARYLEFFERGRSDFLRLADIHHTALLADEAGARYWVVRRMEIDFRTAARIDNILYIETRIAEVGGARIRMKQAITCGDTLIAEAAVEAALIDSQGRAMRLPKSWRDQFSALAKASAAQS